MADFKELTEIFDEVAPMITVATEPEQALAIVTAACVAAVPNADTAAVTLVHPKRSRTVAATSELACRVDELQYELHEGPCLEAALRGPVFWTDDLATDPRWPRLGRRAVRETGVRSMLSLRLFLEPTDRSVLAGLNLYSTAPAAFDERARMTGQVLATYAALALTSSERGRKIVHLERALETSRMIGTAIGILMARHLITADQGFDLLRLASQQRHRKLAEIAVEVVETGQLRLDQESPALD